MLPIHIKHLNAMIPICNEHFTITRHAYSLGVGKFSLFRSLAAPLMNELSIASEHRHTTNPRLQHINKVIVDTHSARIIKTTIGIALGSKLTSVTSTAGFE